MIENDCQQIPFICSNTLTFSSETKDELSSSLICRNALLSQPGFVWGDELPFIECSDVTMLVHCVYTVGCTCDG